MEQIRKPFQGIWNIVRFNWHFYLLSVGLILIIFLLNTTVNESYRIFGNLICLLIAVTTLISLLVSFYVYDLSGLYQLNWLNDLQINKSHTLVTINAGFDETSALLKHKFPNIQLSVFDFYNPLTHTEVSIKRARKAYPAYPNTIQVTTSHLPLTDNYSDNIVAILAAHEIRNEKERIVFFKELKRILNDNGKIAITEHLRDLPNFLAYNIGFLHFLSKPCWYRTFKNAGLSVSNEIKITPFITTFILQKNGTTA
jgi:ubiquinone/menaquinone biosynthesis C-methylase UbiE